jgi:hypothetical protein
MIRNPFVTESALSLPLQMHVCQEIHYRALRAAMYNQGQSAVPERIDLFLLGRHAKCFGSEAYLSSALTLEAIFRGVTSKVFEVIEQLYCSRERRSINMIARILRVMAERVGVEPVSNEAIWAICLYLQERRAAKTDITIERHAATWQILIYEPVIQVSDAMVKTYTPIITYVLDTARSRVLAFRVDQAHSTNALRLAFYDALVLQRHSAPRGAKSIIWFLPEILVTEEATHEDVHASCAELNIKVQKTPAAATTIVNFESEWNREFTGRVLPDWRFRVIFDNYLAKLYDHSPLEAQAQQAHAAKHLIGLQHDPAEQLAPLRYLLPAYQGIIENDGSVSLDGLHYANDLLGYWPGYEVRVRKSQQTEAVAWIYLNDGVLCTAHARELRRKDGTYRQSRP